MYKNILLWCRHSAKNEKHSKEVSKLIGEGTVVTVLNGNQRNKIAQASIKAVCSFKQTLLEERSKRLEKTRKASVEDYGIDYDQIIVRGNAREELLKHANSGKYEIVVLGNCKAEDKRKFVLKGVATK